MNQYGVFNLNEKRILYPLDKIALFESGDILYEDDEIWNKDNILNLNYIFIRNTNISIKDRYIYEYDLLRYEKKREDEEFDTVSGVVTFRKGMFYLSNIHVNGQVINKKIAFIELFNDSNIRNVEILDSILSTTSAYDFIRNRFAFKFDYIDNKESLAIDDKGNILEYTNGTFKEVEKDNSEHIFLSTDYYDSEGDMLYDYDNVVVKYKNGREYQGKIGFKKGYYVIFPLIDTNIRTIYLNNFFNENKYFYLKKVD